MATSRLSLHRSGKRLAESRRAVKDGWSNY
jgi:hypothetical protein